MTTASHTMIARIAGHRGQTKAFRLAILWLLVIGVTSMMRAWPPPALSDDSQEAR